MSNPMQDILGSVASSLTGQQGANPLLAAVLQLLAGGLGGGQTQGGGGGGLGDLLAAAGGRSGGGLGGMLGGGGGGAGGGLGDLLGGLLGGGAASGAMAGGGVNDLLERFRGAGMGQAVDSWIGTGPNAPVSGDQLEQALGADTLSAIASRVGMDKGALGGGLAQMLPQVIDALTPHGKLPEGGFGNAGQILEALQGAMTRR